MSQLADRISQFHKMTTEDPENELGHFRLGQLYTEATQYTEAVESFKRTLELSPQFSKVYQLLGECYIKLERPDEAIATFTQGYAVANERGDKLPRDAMANHMAKLGAPIPAETASAPVEDDGIDTGYRCARPGCTEGKRAKQLEKPPIDGPHGLRIYQEICSVCWDSWWKGYSKNVINELRLDLGSESGHAEYDRNMCEYFGFESNT